MNGVHDMGGLEGLGQIAAEANEPVFHAPWEARAFALNLAAGAWGRWTIDGGRHQRELIPAADYLRMSYYERWLAGLEALLVKTAMVSSEELAAGRPAADAAKAIPALSLAQAQAGRIRARRPAEEVPAPRRFTPGDAVRARNIHPSGYTRLPRYARGKTGVVADDRGVHLLADANAEGPTALRERLYSVRFAARELWGEAAGAADTVFIDLWDSHLDPA